MSHSPWLLSISNIGSVESWDSAGASLSCCPVPQPVQLLLSGPSSDRKHATCLAPPRSLCPSTGSWSLCPQFTAQSSWQQPSCLNSELDRGVEFSLFCPICWFGLKKWWLHKLCWSLLYPQTTFLSLMNPSFTLAFHSKKQDTLWSLFLVCIAPIFFSFFHLSRWLGYSMLVM